MKRIFLDVGAFDGDTIKIAIESGHYDEIYAFEPLAKLFHELTQQFGNNPNVKLIKAAASNKDGTATLFKGNDLFHDLSGSMFQIKTVSGEKEEIQTIDFSKFLRDKFDSQDDIILKLNIEGAEYEVLSQLIDTGAISFVNYLYCDWHYGLLGMSQETHFALVKRLRRRGFSISGGNRYDKFNNVYQIGRAKLSALRHLWHWRYRFRSKIKTLIPAPLLPFLRKFSRPMN